MGEVALTGRSVGDFGEFPNQFLEDEAHARVVDRLGCRSMFANESVTKYSRLALSQALDLRIEVKCSKMSRTAGEKLDVGVEVLSDMVLVAQQLDQVQRRRVVEALPGPCAAGRARGSARPWSWPPNRPGR